MYTNIRLNGVETMLGIICEDLDRMKQSTIQPMSIPFPLISPFTICSIVFSIIFKVLMCIVVFILFSGVEYEVEETENKELSDE